MMFRIILLFFLGAIQFECVSQIVFTSNFENGRLDTVYQQGGVYHLWPISNLHVEIQHVENLTPEFAIFDSLGYQLRPYHFMVYRYHADTVWHFFDTAYKATASNYYHFKNFSAFDHDTVFLAYWFPYSYTDVNDFMATISNSLYVKNDEVKTHSFQNRNIYGFEITDSSIADCYKRHVVLTARQHPVENINGYFIEGFVNFLIDSSDTLSAYLRRHYRFFIYPMLNPDGVFNGSGQNALGQGLNREWEDSLMFSGTPEIDSIRPVILFETNGRVDWSIDLHANPGSNIKYYWWGYNSNSTGVSARQITMAANYVAAVENLDWINGISLFQSSISGNGVNNSLTAANWFRRTFNAVSYTFEPTSEPLGIAGDNRITRARMKMAGSSMAKGFANLHDTLPPFGSKIIALGDTLICNPFGGAPPYSISWTTPLGAIITGNNLFNAVNGQYFIKVIDSNGCAWSGIYNFNNSSFNNDDYFLNHNILFYPNPINQDVLKIADWLIGCRFRITDLSARLLMTGVLEDNELSLGHLSGGILIIHIEKNRTWSQFKIIKQ